MVDEEISQGVDGMVVEAILEGKFGIVIVGVVVAFEGLDKFWAAW